jgi:hypothetical protein
MVNARFGGDAVPAAARVAVPALMVMAVILFMGTVSGGRLDPALSLAFALRGNFPWRRVPARIAPIRRPGAGRAAALGVYRQAGKRRAGAARPVVPLARPGVGRRSHRRASHGRRLQPSPGNSVLPVQPKPRGDAGNRP